MKSLLWSLKAGVLVAALLLLSGGHTFGVRAQDEGIGIENGGEACVSYSCVRSSTNQCFCVAGGGCGGCFILNGQSGCGECAIGPG
jgi:hypothetical protein